MISRRTLLKGAATIGAFSFVPRLGLAASAPTLPRRRVYVGYYGDRRGTVEAAMGAKMALGRVYVQASTPSSTVSVLNTYAKSQLDAGILPIISAKCGTGGNEDWSWTDDWRAVASGAYDGWWKRQRAAALADGRKFVLALHHEPELDGRADAYRAACYHAYHTFHTDAAGNWSPVPNIRWAYIVGGERAVKNPYRNPHDASDPNNGDLWADAYWPAVGVHYLGCAPYSWCASTGWQQGSFAYVSDQLHAYAAGRRTPYFYTEVGRYADSGQDEWVEAMAPTLLSYASDDRRAGCKGFVYFDRDSRYKGHCDWRLTDASIAQWDVFASTAGFRTR